MGKNYGDFLLDTVEVIKEQFTDKEYEWLKESATEISNIENKLTELEEKYPEVMQKSMDGDMSMPAGSDMSNPPDDGSMQKFPAFEGKDLDGNAVKSDELFSGNAVTVVNFWFTTCNPCVGELSELDALNKELAEKGGALIGVNTFTLDGDEAAISEAKDVLAKKGATYQNVYFDSDSEAGKFTVNIFAYPTTYVVDRSGNIVGDPIVGAITGKEAGGDAASSNRQGTGCRYGLSGGLSSERMITPCIGSISASGCSGTAAERLPPGGRICCRKMKRKKAETAGQPSDTSGDESMYMDTTENVIYLAGGCFWGLEHLMQSIPGVLDAESGYANGIPAEDADYKTVCKGETGFRETVRVEYDPEKVSLDALLLAYFFVIDPTVENRQGNDCGSQYQTGIYYTNESARETVERIAGARARTQREVLCRGRSAEKLLSRRGVPPGLSGEESERLLPYPQGEDRAVLQTAHRSGQLPKAHRGIHPGQADGGTVPGHSGGRHGASLQQ